MNWLAWLLLAVSAHATVTCLFRVQTNILGVYLNEASIRPRRVSGRANKVVFTVDVISS